MSSCLRLSPHPFEFGAIQVVGPFNLRPLIVDTFLAFLQIICIVAAIGIYSAVVEFDDHRAHTIEEESVVSHHKQCLVASRQKALKPFNHLKVEMVGWFVENEQVGFCDEHICQCHPLLLSATQLTHGLVEVAYLQLGENLLGLEYLLILTLVVETSLEHRFLRVEHRRLLKYSHLNVFSEYDTARIGRVVACE